MEGQVSRSPSVRGSPSPRPSTSARDGVSGKHSRSPTRTVSGESERVGRSLCTKGLQAPVFSLIYILKLLMGGGRVKHKVGTLKGPSGPNSKNRKSTPLTPDLTISEQILTICHPLSWSFFWSSEPDSSFYKIFVPFSPSHLLSYHLPRVHLIVGRGRTD